MLQLKNHINQFVSLTDEEFERIKTYFEAEQLQKGDYFQKQGTVCNKISFLRRGVVRSFYLIDGEEITRFVLLKDRFVTALSSFISQQPTPENIQAVTDCELLSISYADVQHLYETFPKWQKLGRLILENSHLLLEKRVLALISLTAEERYEKLSIEQPEILKQVPLQYIASILGVKPETLSRIRKKKS